MEKKSRPEALALAERMVEAWQKDSRPWDYYSAGANRPEASHRVEMMSGHESVTYMGPVLD